MDKKKIAVVYDGSYLTGAFHSIKKFILERRFSTHDKPGLFKLLRSKISGVAAEGDSVRLDAGDMFVVNEVIPREEIRSIEAASSGEEAGQQAVAALLADGAAEVDLSMDTVVSTAGARLHLDHDKDLADEILVYLSRLASFRTNENYQLVVLATEDESLIERVADLARDGKAVIAVKSKQLGEARELRDKLRELANADTATGITLDN